MHVTCMTSKVGKGEHGLATQIPHQIVVYPNRVKLLGYALTCSLGTAVSLFVCLLLVSGSRPVNLQLGVLATVLAVIEILGRLLIGTVMLATALVLAAVVVCIIYRILVRKPSAIINSHGIIDQCSLFAGGLGLIRWDEIENIILYAYRKNLKYFCITTHEKRAPANPLIRLFRRSITLFLLDGANLPQWLLSTPVNDIAAEIERCYQATLLVHEIDIIDWLPSSNE